jgi:N-methylhydantoinase B/oxoprolinase/acetone carboxylase alpha subunit
MSASGRLPSTPDDPSRAIVLAVSEGPGAGGHGEPRQRDPTLVQRDVADGVVSEHMAETVSGITG